MLKMKKGLISILIISFVLMGLKWNSNDSKTSPGIIERVDELISQMTLEEKIGQMTQVTIQAVSKTQGTVDQEFEIDPEKLKVAITKYHVGSILNV